MTGLFIFCCALLVGMALLVSVVLEQRRTINALGETARELRRAVDAHTDALRSTTESIGLLDSRTRA